MFILHIENIYQPGVQAICKCWSSCTVIDYEVKDTTHFDDWTYFATTNISKNKWEHIYIYIDTFCWVVRIFESNT